MIISLEAPKDLKDRVRDKAKDLDRSQSWVWREAMKQYLGESKPKTKAVAKPKPVVDVPSYIDGDAWLAFIECRKRLKAPNTERAIKLILSKLAKFHAEGLNVNEIIDQSVENGWKGVFAPKGSKNNLQTNISEAMDFING